MTVVVLGAGRGIGREIARQVAADGREVRGVSRSGGVPDGVEDVRADLLDREAAVKAVRGASVVHLAANVPYPSWADTLPTLFDNAVAAAESAGAKLVLADNLYAYGPVSGPLTEDTPERPVGPKEKLRSALGKRLRQASVPVVLARSSDYYGPGGVGSLAGELLLKPMALGKRAMWFGPLDVPHTFAYLGDTARAQVVLGDDPRADGRVWHTPAAETLTVREFVALAGRVLGTRGQPRRLPKATVTLVSLFDKRLRGAGELSHQQTEPWVVDHSAFEDTFGPLPVTPHEEAIARTAEWYRG
ncbi:NAD-dependent epimerase/dehydratase family protein [Actinosynnema sp. NPDC047251]|uniref:NAD-dependent epimerase/dehydratase n=1 Tax=Saccharothrix espanaensis (strain ATCC 51144 / DSM 44229 / JCM 9112 / NBRC 15066 / NRRL 15764) TaxID=1179773 RepID=K0K9K2_SACES|nr:NAD-dependent epimerase/dehydratase family protein [Saccharothrix espanaensis]CCH35016.1 NAD-dependent epimerase/dehydratase [Saccharothrix espanaensis DSM 44229]